MKIDPRLHHYCQNITEGHLSDMVDMYKLLGLDVVYAPDSADWVMVAQKELDFAIQITQVSDEPISDIEIKRRTHIAFLSDDPQAVVNKVKIWAESKDITFREGGWSDIERYFDLPDIFSNFVIEVMHSSIEEQ
jgi:hypothetical protein